MISPQTPPGTKIICIDADANGKYMSAIWLGGLDGLQKGQIYTVRMIYPTKRTVSGFGVLLHEIMRGGNHGWAIDRFKYLELPKCLTDALDTQPMSGETKICWA